MIPCLPNKKRQHRTSFIGDELHAFDLTWRNYIPSFSQVCCNNNRIQLSEEDDDGLIEPPYYNDHRLYRGEAIQNYMNNSRDLEFDSVLNQDPNQITTRNPFGSKKDKKKKKKKKNKLAVMETDLEEDIAAYHIEHDAEFLADDQIANLVYYNNKQHDEYRDIIVQSPQQQQQQFYAAKTMPNLAFYEQEEEEEQGSSSQQQQQQPLVSVEAAQTLLSGKLDDLTERLTFIKNNIIQLRPKEEEFDRTTLHTIHPEDEREESHDDIDSITSEALHVYNNNNNQTDELQLPSLANLVSDQHPFSYFTEQNTNTNNDLNVQNVLDIGRKWLGV